MLRLGDAVRPWCMSYFFGQKMSTFTKTIHFRTRGKIQPQRAAGADVSAEKRSRRVAEASARAVLLAEAGLHPVPSAAVPMR